MISLTLREGKKVGLDLPHYSCTSSLDKSCVKFQFPILISNISRISSGLTTKLAGEQSKVMAHEGTVHQRL